MKTNKEILDLLKELINNNEVIDVDNLTSFLMKVYKSFKVKSKELRSLETWGGYTYTIDLNNFTFNVDGYSTYCDVAFYSYKSDFEDLKEKCDKFLLLTFKNMDLNY